MKYLKMRLKVFMTRVNLSIFILFFCLYSGSAFSFLPTVGKAPQDVVDKFFPEGKDVKVKVGIEGLSSSPISAIF